MNNENTLPIYSELKGSAQFQSAFSHTGTNTSVMCICGRLHFAERYVVDDDDDAIEKERLERLSIEQPDVYISHPDGPSYFTSTEHSVVFGCSCNYSGFLEGLLIEHAGSIVNYFISISSGKKKTTDEFHNKVREIKTTM